MIGHVFDFGLASGYFEIISIIVAATVSLILYAFYPFYYGAKIAAWE